MSEMEADQGAQQGDIFAQRQTQYEKLKEAGVEIYPNRFERELTVGEILALFTGEEVPERTVTLAGRVMSKRPMGKAGFLHLQDQTGQIQVYGNNKLLDEKEYFIFQNIDIGDLVGVSGELFRTKIGEPSVRINRMAMLSKNLFPLPVVKEKDGKRFDEFSDVEARYRRRYLDLIVNPEVRETFQTRSQVVQKIREFLTQKGFMEVETPMMQSVASGAAAKPFRTHHNALGMDLYLRIAPELYLKRLIAGGFEKVFELNRNFRNEGISVKHNPEFTMMEVYEAYADYNNMMELTEQMFAFLAKEVTGDTKVPYNGVEIDLTPPWPRKPYLESIREKTGLDFSVFLAEEEPSLEKAKEMAKEAGIDASRLHTFWEVVDEIFSEKVEGELIQPVFITDYPKAMSPLAKNIPGNGYLVERFEPYIVGREMGNAFSELNDPFEQKERFLDQLRQKEAGQEETIEMDEDFIDVLKVGMPPTGGLGIGIDRLVMLLTDSQTIKDVILFPLLRKKEEK